MENFSTDQWPEVVFGSSDSTLSARIQRAVKAGRLVKLSPRIYTSKLHDSPETIIRRNRYPIISYLFPQAVISHRSARS
jgi:hypothetical protein